jgi:hypothetical protein
VSAKDDWNKRSSSMLDGKVVSLEETIERCKQLEETCGGFVGTAVVIARKTWAHVGGVELALVPLMVATT